MDEKVGQRAYVPAQRPFLPGIRTDSIEAAEATAREIDLAVRDIIAEAFHRASELLQHRRPDLEKGVDLLLTRETLTAEDFPAIRSSVAPADEHLITALRQEQ